VQRILVVARFIGNARQPQPVQLVLRNTASFSAFFYRNCHISALQKMLYVPIHP
jgi:hypothetical protein